jgi:hypothetical protein
MLALMSLKMALPSMTQMIICHSTQDLPDIVRLTADSGEAGGRLGEISRAWLWVIRYDRECKYVTDFFYFH